MNNFHQALERVSSAMAAGAEKSLLLPPQASTAAPSTDWLFNFITYVSLFFFVVIVALMIFFCVRYLRKTEGEEVHPGMHHNLVLELAWSILPAFLLIFMFYEGFIGYMDQVVVPEDAYEIQVEARQWSWTFQYPNGYQDSNLIVPVNTPVVLTMKSDDVIHSFYVPEFRVKMDVVPGKYSQVWFEATQTTKGDPLNPDPANDEPFHLFCTEYCGTDHSNMTGDVWVLEQDEFENWLAIVSNEDVLPPEVRGEKRYRVLGCVQCHSIDGSAGNGPTWKGIWEREAQITGQGTQVTDADYIRESIIYPNRKIVEGYGAIMPSYKGKVSERDIDDIIAYMKTLK